MKRFLKDESGATVMEYVLIAATMAVVLVAGMATLGPKIEQAFGPAHDTHQPDGR